MTDDNNTQQDQQGGSILPKVAVGAALVGAGVLAAKALSDPENQEKIKDGIADAQERGAEVVAKLNGDLQELRDRVQKAMDENGTNQALQELWDKLKAVGDSLQDVGDAAKEDAQNAIADARKRLDDLRAEYEDMDMDAAA